jgi:hypothetical protein
MSLFGKLFGGLLPKRRDDPLFGRMTWFPIAKHPERNYWEGACTFAPANDVVEFIVDADEEGPSDLQRARVSELEVRWSSIEARVVTMLTARSKEILGGPLDVPFARKFKLGLISIPRLPASPTAWDITYEDRETGELLEVEMKDDEPVLISFGG